MARWLVALVVACVATAAYAQNGFPASPVLSESEIPPIVNPKLQPGGSNLTLFLTLYGQGYQTYVCNNLSTWVQDAPYHQLYVLSPSCNGPFAATVGACSAGGPVGQFYTINLGTRLGAALEIFNPLTVMQSVRVNITTGEDNIDGFGLESIEWNLQRVTTFNGGNGTNLPQTNPQAAINRPGGPAPTALSSPNLPSILDTKYWMRGFPQGGAAPPYSCLFNTLVHVPVTSYFLFWK